MRIIKNYVIKLLNYFSNYIIKINLHYQIKILPVNFHVRVNLLSGTRLFFSIIFRKKTCFLRTRFILK